MARFGEQKREVQCDVQCPVRPDGVGARRGWTKEQEFKAHSTLRSLMVSGTPPNVTNNPYTSGNRQYSISKKMANES